jgi:hypothetical protein
MQQRDGYSVRLKNEMPPLWGAVIGLRWYDGGRHHYVAERKCVALCAQFACLQGFYGCSSYQSGIKDTTVVFPDVRGKIIPCSR